MGEGSMETPALPLYVEGAMWMLSSAVCHSVCFQDYPLSYHEPGLFRDLQGMPFASNSTKCNPVPPLEVIPGYKRWPVLTPYTLLQPLGRKGGKIVGVKGDGGHQENKSHKIN